jgi:O-antigen/teichoic acid export membrane protein
MSAVFTTAQQVLTAERSYRSLLILDGGALAALGSGGLVFHAHVSSPGAAMWLVACARLLSGLVVLLRKGLFLFVARKSEVAPLVRYAREASLNSLATFFNLRVDPILVGTFSGAAEAARWGLAAPVISAYMLLGEAVNLELFPAVSALSLSREYPGLRSVVRRSCTLWCGVSLAMTAFLILAPVAHWLPGSRNLASDVTILIWVLALAGPVLVAGRIAASVNNGLGFPAHNSRATVLGLALKLSLGVGLVWSLGALGAALGVFCAVALVALVSIVLARREALHRRVF